MSPTPTSDSKSSDWIINENAEPDKSNHPQEVARCVHIMSTSNKPAMKFNFKNNFLKLCMNEMPVDEAMTFSDQNIMLDVSTSMSSPCFPCVTETETSTSTALSDVMHHDVHTSISPKPRLKRGVKFHLSDQKYVAIKTQAIKQDVEKAAQDIEKCTQTTGNIIQTVNSPRVNGVSAYMPHTSRRGNRCLHLWSDVEDNAPPHRKSKMLNEEEMSKYMKKYSFKERQVIDYEEAFLVFDLDVDGVITVDELGTVMVALGQRPSLEEIQALIQGVDSDNSGTVDFDEFLGMMAARMHSDPEEELKEVFGVFDSDADGYISAYELYDVLSRLDDSITRDEVDFMIKEADTNGDGKVDFAEFQNILHGK